MGKKTFNVLWIDWWKKYLWMAYIGNDMNIIMPIWYVLNDKSIFFSVTEIISRYNIKKIVIGYPSQGEEIREKIDGFIDSLFEIYEKTLEVEKVNEDYSSVEAGSVTGDYNKNAAEDTIAAIKILERWLSGWNNQ